MNATTLAAFEALREKSKGQNAVFINQRGEALQGARYWFEPAVEDAKITDFTWHCLRHTFPNRLAMKGKPIRTIQELMGHKTIQMTVRYAHLAPQHTLAAVERLCEPIEVESNEEEAQEKSTDTRTNTSNFDADLEQAVAV